jgi:hypothetical protein
MRQDGVDVVVRTRNDMHTDQLATDGLDSLGTGIRRSLDGCHITYHDSGYKGVTHLLHGASQLDIRRFQHRVSAFYEGNQTAGFYHSYCLI